MFLLSSVLPAMACVPDSFDFEDELLWPRAGGFATPADGWVFVALSGGSSPASVVLADEAGVEVPLASAGIGPLGNRTVYALIPEQPLTLGMAYTVHLGNGPDASFVALSPTVEPAEPPALLERTVVADVTSEEEDGDCSATDRIEYEVCGDPAFTVVSIGGGAPPEDARDASLAAVHLGPGAEAAGDTIGLAAGAEATVWVGAMDARGHIAWAEPDTFTVPEDDWIETTTATATELVSGVCPAWEGWGPSERECGGPDCRPEPAEANGCATAPGGPLAPVLALLPLLRRAGHRPRVRR